MTRLPRRAVASRASWLEHLQIAQHVFNVKRQCDLQKPIEKKSKLTWPQSICLGGIQWWNVNVLWKSCCIDLLSHDAVTSVQAGPISVSKWVKDHALTWCEWCESTVRRPVGRPCHPSASNTRRSRGPFPSAGGARGGPARPPWRHLLATGTAPAFEDGTSTGASESRGKYSKTKTSPWCYLTILRQRLTAFEYNISRMCNFWYEYIPQFPRQFILLILFMPFQIP